MSHRRRISQRLARVFLLQVGFIALAAGGGVYATKVLLESSLIHQALRDEAAHFRSRLADDPRAALPDTRNLKGYLRTPADAAALPDDLRTLQPGFHGLAQRPGFAVAYVERLVDADLILLFDGQRVEELAVLFGMAPLAGVLTLIYVFAWLAYRQSAKAISPVVQLAQEVAAMDPEAPEKVLPALTQLGASGDREVYALTDALTRLTDRIRRFVERERTFTRDVSHELRSPTTVVKMAADLLLAAPTLPADARDQVARIKRAATDMEGLIEAFLLLARESEAGLSKAPVCINDVAADQMELARPLVKGKPVMMTLSAPGRLLLTASERVLAVLLGNVIRNACAYTASGHVRVSIEPGRLLVEDSGIGIAHHQVQRLFEPFFRGSELAGGHGVGLTIVRRLSDRFGWPLTISSEPGAGTRVTLAFPDAEWQPGGADD